MIDEGLLAKNIACEDPSSKKHMRIGRSTRVLCKYCIIPPRKRQMGACTGGGLPSAAIIWECLTPSVGFLLPMWPSLCNNVPTLQIHRNTCEVS